MVDIHFKKEKYWAGGSKFILRAWPRSPSVTVMKDYWCDQHFFVPGMRPTSKIIVVTASHPQGVTVPVKWLGHEDTKAQDHPFGLSVQPLDADANAEPASTLETEPVIINVSVGDSFTVKEALPTSTTGTIDIDFNPHSIRLDSTSASQGYLTWHFTTLESGTAQVVVDTVPFLPHPGLDGLALVRTYYMVVAESINFADYRQLASKAADPLSITKSMFANHVTGSTFLERVTEAQAIVRKTAPEAQPTHVFSSYSWLVLPFQKDPEMFAEFFCMFKTKDGALAIQTSRVNKWDEPKAVPTDSLDAGPRVFDVEGLVDLEDAVKVLQDKKLGWAIRDVRLDGSHTGADTEQQQQPYYLFRTTNGATVRVGAKNKDVVLSEHGDSGLAPKHFTPNLNGS